MTWIIYLLDDAYDSCFFDLWKLGVDLDEVVEHRTMRPSRLAILLFSQPAGANVWKEIGGWMALTPEEMQLQLARDEQMQIAMAQSGSNKEHKPTPPPKGRIEQRQAEAEYARKAKAFRQQQETRKQETIAALDTWGDDWNKGTDRFQAMNEEAKEAVKLWDEKTQQTIT